MPHCTTDRRSSPRRPLAASALLQALLSTAVVLLPSSCQTAEADREDQLLEIYTNTAESYYQLGDHDRAVGQALKALELDPDNEKIKLILGWSLQRRGTTEDVLRAEQVFRSVVDEGDYRASLGLATALERQGVANAEASEAVGSGKRITESSDPAQRAQELQERSVALWTESEQWFEHTLEIHKSSLDALNGLMRVEALLGKPHASLARSKQMLEELAIDRGFWEQLLKRVQGEREEKEIRERIALNENLEVATRMHAARTQYGLGRKDEAMNELDTGIGLAPDRADLHALRALVQRDLGNWDKAIADAERFIALSPQGYDSADVKKAFDLISACEAERSRKP